MEPNAVFQKTAKGEEEIRTRAAKLAPKLRTMLILVDGTKTVGELRAVAERLAVGEDFIAALSQHGLIAPASASPSAAPAAAEAPGAAPVATTRQEREFARFRAAQRFMNDTVVNALGLRSFFLTLKIDKCNTREDLSGLVEDYQKALAKGFSEAEAAVLLERMRELLE